MLVRTREAPDGEHWRRRVTRHDRDHPKASRVSAVPFSAVSGARTHARTHPRTHLDGLHDGRADDRQALCSAVHRERLPLLARTSLPALPCARRGDAGTA